MASESVQDQSTESTSELTDSSKSEISEVKDETLAEALASAYDENTKDVSEEVIEEVASPEVSDEPVEEVTAPEHWSDEDKDSFKHMDESGRDFALRLETNAHKGIQEKSEELKKFRSAFDANKHMFPQGTTAESAFENLVAAHVGLSQDPLNNIRRLMSMYGVDEKQFAPQVEPQEEEIFDPEVKALKDELTQLKSQSEQDRQRVEIDRQNAYVAEIVEFRDAVDDDGETEHPHFNTVYAVMSGLMTSGRASSLDEAYDMAVWSVPEYRDEVVQEKAKEQVKAELEEKAQVADEAKLKASTVNGKSSGKKAKGPKSMADELSENFDKSVRGEL